jgi:hypothetical protein
MCQVRDKDQHQEEQRAKHGGRRGKRAKFQVIELEIGQLETLLDRIKVDMGEDVAQPLRQLLQSHMQLLEIIRDQKISMEKLRKLIFGATTESSRNLLGVDDDSSTEGAPPSSETGGSADQPGAPNSGRPPRPRGHGRNGAAAYTGLPKIRIPHPQLSAGDRCPNEDGGTLYAQLMPGLIARLVGQAPVGGTVYELERLRCNLCGKVFTAPLPEGAGTQKYDETVGSIIGLLKYGGGLPFNRLQKVQRGFGIPLPASTQWDIVHAKAQRIWPVWKELIWQAAQGRLVYMDDTTNKILELMGLRAQKAALKRQESGECPTDEKAAQRTGLFTTGIVSICDNHPIAVFFTGRQHAGENLRDVLTQRVAELEPPIQMCDPLSRNMPADLKTILANCLAHGRRNFVDVIGHFPHECRYVIRALKVIYKNDEEARKQGLSPEARLKFHQTHSQATMDELHQWLNRQFAERLVEPNSGLGKAISYLLNHWERLTLFLRQAGAPLDNNVAERAMKKIILHRKNSLFYKTQNGADVSDLYMSLIYTCELNEVDPFDYMNQIDRHAAKAIADPKRWMPWNYRQTLAELQAGSAVPRAGPCDVPPTHDVAAAAATL